MTATPANPLSELGNVTVETASRLGRITMDSAERLVALQLEFAKASLDHASRNARAAAGARDVADLVALRTRTAETALERLMGYSRGLYEVASDAQSEISRLAEERMSFFQKAVAEGVEQAARSAPAGGDVAVAAMKSSLAATTAAFDSFNKAARNVASYTDAGLRASGTGKAPAKGKSRK